jgi:hypothetical protein
MKPSDDRNELEYLKALVILMMKADSRRGAVDSEVLQLTGIAKYLNPSLNIVLTLTLTQTP